MIQVPTLAQPTVEVCAVETAHSLPTSAAFEAQRRGWLDARADIQDGYGRHHERKATKKRRAANVERVKASQATASDLSDQTLVIFGEIEKAIPVFAGLVLQGVDTYKDWLSETTAKAA